MVINKEEAQVILEALCYGGAGEGVSELISRIEYLLEEGDGND